MASAHRHLLALAGLQLRGQRASARGFVYELLGFRRKAWIELVGCLLFALPYTLVLVWYGWDFVKTAWVFNEGSDAALGLPYRWIIKGIMYAGLWLLLVGIVSVLLRLIAFLFGKRTAEAVELRIGHSVSQV